MGDEAAGELGDEAAEEEVRVSARMAEMLERCPSFSAGLPDIEVEREWSDAELKTYVFSNGLIRPARRKGGQTREPEPADYKVLELTQDAPAEAVRKAYKRLALLHHPDKQRGAAAAAEAARKKFQQIVGAYEAILGHIAEVPPPPPNAEEAAFRRRIVIV